VVLDCGTGAHGLGRELETGGEEYRVGHLLISHTHWDHIQGLPFFQPLFTPGNEWRIYAPGGGTGDLEASLAGQMAYEYSSITLESLDARVRFHNLTEGVFQVGGVRVTTRFLNHPVLTLAYRLEADGATLVYSTDHEPHSLHPIEAPPAATPVHHEDRRHVQFLEEADFVIHDGQYTLDDFPAKAGWGHSPVERAVDYAILARARQLAFTHHDPERDDEAVDRICQMARERASASEQALEVFAATEGQSIELSGPESRVRRPIEPEASALLSEARIRAGTVLIVDDDPDMLLLLEATLQADGVRVLKASNGDSALEIARRDPPTLILLDMDLPGSGGLDVCRTLRAGSDLRLRNVPIVILTGAKLEEKDLVEAFVAGATDYLTKPAKPTLVRSRVRGWLLRTSDQ
jgi:CheY-like chemotaxis protein/phosphoribosyl 1,2-cyclic phosphodiesterase